MESLKNKVVIVTGSSSGIGKSTAILFSKYGSNVVITERNKEKLANVSDLCEDASPNKYKPLTVIGDIGDTEFQEILLKETIELHGKLDILINNAASLKPTNIFSENFPHAFDDAINVNVRAPVMLSRLALPHLISSKGCIVNISSIAAFRWVAEDFLAYNVSKSALDATTKLLAREFGPNGVRVLSVNPGWIKTSIHEQANISETIYDLKAKDYPLRRPGESEEVAKVICFLASSDASFITGTTVLVDGGHSTL